MTDLPDEVANLRRRICCLEIDVESLLGEKEDVRYVIGVLQIGVQDLRDEVRQLREQLTAFHGDPHP